MNKRMQCMLWLILATSCLYQMAEANNDAGSIMDLTKKPTHDGRFGTRCSAWGVDSSKEFCTPSYYRLLAQPEYYDGKMIGLNGFIIEEFGRLILFPSKNDYERNSDVEGIEITGSADTSEDGEVVIQAPEVSDEVNIRLAVGIESVFVVGTFDATYSGVGAPRLGAIRLHHVLISPRIRGME